MNQIFKQGYALLIGVGKDLPITVKDATAVKDILIDSQRCAYPINQVKILTENQATRQGILEGLDWLIAKVQTDPDAMVIVYYSGHGGCVPDYHLLPYNYDQNDIMHTAVSGAEFTEKLRAIQTKKLLILLDCCHAGGMAEVKSGFIKAPSPPELENILSAGSGRVVIASSRKDEVSRIGDPYSKFTQALLEGLAGYGAAENNGYAYLTDVAMYIGHVVPNNTDEKQHPILKLAAADDFAIAYYAGGEKSPKPLPKPLPNTDKQTTILSTLSTQFSSLSTQFKFSLVFLIIVIFFVIFALSSDSEKSTIRQDIRGEGIGVTNKGSGSVTIIKDSTYSNDSDEKSANE
jgi:hypothetical protein